MSLHIRLMHIIILHHQKHTVLISDESDITLFLYSFLSMGECWLRISVMRGNSQVFILTNILELWNLQLIVEFEPCSLSDKSSHHLTGI